MFEDQHIVLASSSPRRKDLLERAGMAFRIKVIPVKEDFPPNIPVEEVPEYLAEKKAAAVREFCNDNELIIAADTIVLLGNEVIGKPTDDDHARQILRALSGKAHRVITGVCLMRGRCIQTFTEQTQVFFYTLSDDQINYYVTRYQPMDKAGAYAIQEWIGLTGIEKIEGDYFNVVGLPVGRLIQEIAMFDAKAQTSY